MVSYIVQIETEKCIRMVKCEYQSEITRLMKEYDDTWIRVTVIKVFD